MKKATFFFYLGILRPGDRLFICLKIRQFTAVLYSKIEKRFHVSFFECNKKIHVFGDVNRIPLNLCLENNF